MSDVARAFDALTSKQHAVQTAWDYYDGRHPLVYTNERLREIFSPIQPVFTQNWCAAVVDAVADRIALQGFRCQDQAATDTLSRLWSALDLAVEADDAHKAALVTGEGFLFLWADDLYGVQAYCHDPRLAHAAYDPANPRALAWAAKWWDDEAGKRRLMLLYPDRVETYISRGKASELSSASGLEPLDDPAPNPWGVVPVAHFRPERRLVKSDLTDVVPIQNGINKLLIDMMVAAEFGAFPQKWVISQVDTFGKLKNSPSIVWDIPASDGEGQPTSVGQFDATELRNYLDAIDTLATSLASITRTPKHYFVRQGGDPSGDALVAMEAPLVKKVQDRIDRFAPVWRQAAALLLRMSGQSVAPDSITPVWADPRTVQPLASAMKLREETTAGVPLRTALRWAGRSEDELAQMDEDAPMTTEDEARLLLVVFQAASEAVNAGIPLETFLRKYLRWTDDEIAAVTEQADAEAEADAEERAQRLAMMQMQQEETDDDQEAAGPALDGGRADAGRGNR